VNVAIFGLGYVGTVSAACLAARGHTVWGVDVDADKVSAIAAGQSPVMEPGLGELVASMVASGALHASTDPAMALAAADVSLICVGTPSLMSGATDLSYVKRVAEVIATTIAALPEPPASHVVAVRSTVPPGTVDDVVAPALVGAGVEFATAMCPEFLREGSGVQDFFDPPFTVVGTEDTRAAELLSTLLAPPETSARVVAIRTAEALKYACNAFHATKVAFANEIGRAFRPLGIDTREVMELFCEDRRLNISPNYLRPGFAFGGPCLPKDLRALLHLARQASVDLPVLAGTLSSNEVSLSDVLDRVVASDGMTVALLGLTFKPSSDDLRESPSVRLAESLIGKGYDVRIHDPVVNPARLVGTNRRYIESTLPHVRRLLTDSATAVVTSSDASIVSALLEAAPPRIIDVTGRLGPAVELLAGYEGIAW
jgi:GDP-mannose 6-dehydrogenase